MTEKAKRPAATVGWIGTGRMGFAMAKRLVAAGVDVTVYNRTRAKAQPLVERGARLADSVAALADRDIVFTMLGGPNDVVENIAGPEGLLSRPGHAPKVIVDCTTISMEAAREARAAAAKAGSAFLDAPVSGNPYVVEAGLMSFICSGARAAFDTAKPYLDLMGKSATYAGEGELARIVKICHNTFLGAMIQSLVETTILANKAGVPRHAYLEFINNSALGSMFTRYKSPALVNLDFKPTFTPPLLQKDMDLGLAAARELHVSMPVSAATREIVQNLVARGYVDCDFAALIELEAEASGMKIAPEGVAVDKGLPHPKD
jgi:3-hydroxyisobutyrate dehydrogenase